MVLLAVEDAAAYAERSATRFSIGQGALAHAGASSDAADHVGQFAHQLIRPLGPGFVLRNEQPPRAGAMCSKATAAWKTPSAGMARWTSGGPAWQRWRRAIRAWCLPCAAPWPGRRCSRRVSRVGAFTSGLFQRRQDHRLEAGRQRLGPAQLHAALAHHRQRAGGHRDAAQLCTLILDEFGQLELNGEGRFAWWHRALDDHTPKTLNRAGFRRLLGADGRPVKSDADHLRE